MGWGVVLDASLPVKIVFLALFLFSVASFFIIFLKTFLLIASAREQGGLFRALERTTSLQGFIGSLKGSVREGSFSFGMLESLGALQQGRLDEDKWERTLLLLSMEKMAQLRRFMDFLATIASSSPYIGLLGTVYGIIHAFFLFGERSDVSIQLLAPAIAEALYATGFALFVAIPALIGFNLLSTALRNREDGFVRLSESLLQRTYHEKASS